MQTRRRVLLAFMLLATLVAGCRTLPRHPRRLRYEPLQFERSEPTRTTLDNGMVVYLMEDHELPLVNAHFMIRTGEIYDPEDKIGLAELAGTVLRTGGAADRSGDEINQRLEFLAASIETGIGTQEGSANLSCLSKDLDEVLGLLADVLRRPRFAEDKIDLKKKQMAEAIRRQNDSPGAIVGREFSHLVFASSRAWAREPTFETLDRITRDDLVRFHGHYFHPNNIIAGFSGDFDSAELLKRLGELFGDWPRREVALPAVAPVAKDNQPSVNYVYKDIPQSYIQLGHLGMRRHDPLHYAASVMNYILGAGGFTSRLTEEVRSNRGLAYSVGCRLTDDTDRGRFAAWCQTKSESTHEAISVILDIVRRMATDPIGDDEMEKAKSSLVNRFVFRFETPRQVVNEQVNLEYYGYPRDYLDIYIDKILAVTKDDVYRVARQFIHSDQMIIVVVGDKARFGRPLDEFGAVREIELTKYD